MAHDLVPLGESIDLLNVAFENPRVVKAANPKVDANIPCVSAYESCPDRITGRRAVEELRKICPRRTWKFVAVGHFIILS
jgi:hypothetical protein